MAGGARDQNKGFFGAAPVPALRRATLSAPPPAAAVPGVTVPSCRRAAALPTRHLWPGPACASWDGLETFFRSRRQVSSGRGFIFLWGRRGAGAKDVPIKYPEIGAAGGSEQKLQFPWHDFSPLFTSARKYLAFPGRVRFTFVSKRWLCFRGCAALRGAPRVPPPCRGRHRLAHQLGGRWAARRPRRCLAGRLRRDFRARARTHPHARTHARACAYPPLRPVPRLHPSLSRPPCGQFQVRALRRGGAEPSRALHLSLWSYTQSRVSRFLSFRPLCAGGPPAVSL